MKVKQKSHLLFISLKVFSLYVLNKSYKYEIIGLKYQFTVYATQTVYLLSIRSSEEPISFYFM